MNSGGPSKISAIVARAPCSAFLAARVVLAGAGRVLALEHDEHVDAQVIGLVVHERRAHEAGARLLRGLELRDERLEVTLPARLQAALDQLCPHAAFSVPRSDAAHPDRSRARTPLALFGVQEHRGRRARRRAARESRRRRSRARVRRSRRARSPARAPSGAAPRSIARAKRSQSQRPATMPIGTPMTTPITTATVDCHATTAASWRRVKPSVLSSASSRRRRRTEATRISDSANDRAEREPAGEDHRRAADAAVVHDLRGPLHADQLDVVPDRVRVGVQGPVGRPRRCAAGRLAPSPRSRPAASRTKTRSGPLRFGSELSWTFRNAADSMP